MPPPPSSSASGLPIAAVERDTGLSKDTLRVWERRYGFPRPRRDARGERVYPQEQVDKLRLLKRLMDQGFRPGKIAERPVEELEALVRAGPARTRRDAAAEPDAALQAHLRLLHEHRIEELKRELARGIVGGGLAHFVTAELAPLTTLVGEGWARGEIAVFEEHLFTEAAQAVLRPAIASVPQAGGAPRVLLTTVPQEHHGLGVLMAEALFTLHGARCVPLGVRTPVVEIVRAADTQRIDIVALSYTPVVSPSQVIESLKELRAALPASMELWAGGTSPVLRRRPPPGVQVLAELSEIGPALTRWRAWHRRS